MQKERGFSFSPKVRDLAGKVMADGVLDFVRDADTLKAIIDILFAQALEHSKSFLPLVTGRSLMELITQQVLALDDEFGWDAPGIGEEREDQLLSWLVQRRVRQLIKRHLGEQALEGGVP